MTTSSTVCPDVSLLGTMSFPGARELEPDPEGPEPELEPEPEPEPDVPVLPDCGFW